MCFSNEDIKLYDNLMWPLEFNNHNKALWNDKCDYIELENCENFNKDNYNFIVMQLNVRSLLAHQQELKHPLRMLDHKGSKVGALLLCETFLTDKTLKLVNILDYKLISNNQHDAKGGGTAILIRKNIPYRIRRDLMEFQEKEAEMTYIEVSTRTGKSTVLGSLYRSPNTKESLLINHITKVTSMVKSEKSNKQLILGMDHNLDLLKSDMHAPTCKFLDTLLDADMLPTITRPTQIMQHSAM